MNSTIKLSSFLLMTMLFLTSAQAQTWETIVSSINNDRANSVLEVNGGYIAQGYSSNFDNVGDMVILKLDLNGQLVWSQAYGNAGTKQEGYDLSTAASGTILSCGYDHSGANGYDAFLVKTDAQGNELWSKTYGWGYDEKAKSVQEMSNGKIAVLVEVDIPGATEIVTVLLILNANGSLGYYNVILGTPREVIETTDGNLLMVVSQLDDNAYAQIHTRKVSPTGATIWETSVPNAFNDIGYGVSESTNGNFYITGSTQVGAPLDYLTDLYVVCLDSNGDLLWTENHGASNKYDGGYSIVATSDNALAVTGRTSSYGDTWGDLFIAKLSETDGSLSWLEIYGNQDQVRDVGNCLRECSDNGFVIGGYTSIDPAATEQDLYVIKTDQWGELPSGIIAIEDLVILDDTSKVSKYQAKAANQGLPLTDFSDYENADIQIFDINGRLISIEKYSQFSWNDYKGRIQTGIYYFRVVDAQELLLEGKYHLRD